MGPRDGVGFVTFSEISADVYRRLNFDTTPATAVQTRIKAFINQRHRQILAIPGMELLRDAPKPMTFASVASQSTYAMGPNVARIKDIYDGTTNQLKLTERSVQWLRTMDPRSTNTGTPESWIPITTAQVQTQPSAATGVYVKSTSASDGASTTAYIETARTGGYRASASVAMNGVTGTLIGSQTDHIEVDKFYLSAVAVGTVTLETAASGGTVLATIPPGQSYARFLIIQLWPIPSAVVTYSVDFTREIADMVNATDEPLLPSDFHPLLSTGARIDEYEKMDDDRRTALLRDWKVGTDALKNFVINGPDYLIVPGGSNAQGSNLGGMYPAGRW